MSAPDLTSDEYIRLAEYIRANLPTLFSLSQKADGIWRAIRSERQVEVFEDSNFLVTVESEMNEIDRDLRRLIFAPQRVSDFHILNDRLHNIELQIVKSIIAYNEQLVTDSSEGLTKAQLKGHYALFKLIAELKEELAQGKSRVYLTHKDKLEQLKTLSADFENQADEIKQRDKRDKAFKSWAIVGAIGAIGGVVIWLLQIIGGVILKP